MSVKTALYVYRYKNSCKNSSW